MVSCCGKWNVIPEKNTVRSRSSISRQTPKESKSRGINRHLGAQEHNSIVDDGQWVNHEVNMYTLVCETCYIKTPQTGQLYKTLSVFHKLENRNLRPRCRQPQCLVRPSSWFINATFLLFVYESFPPCLYRETKLGPFIIIQTPVLSEQGPISMTSLNMKYQLGYGYKNLLGLNNSIHNDIQWSSIQS